jgi:hypothetical protein
MRLDWEVLGSAMVDFLAISYVLCVSYDLLFGAEMYRALVFAPLYNLFLVKVWRHAS